MADETTTLNRPLIVEHDSNRFGVEAMFLDENARRAVRLFRDLRDSRDDSNAIEIGGGRVFDVGIALRDAVTSAVAAHGVNGVTRTSIFEQLDQIHNFSADSFFAPFDLAGRRITTCGVIMQVRHGAFVRVRPT